jgi:hypothetical protein
MVGRGSTSRNREIKSRVEEILNLREGMVMLSELTGSRSDV